MNSNQIAWPVSELILNLKRKDVLKKSVSNKRHVSCIRDQRVVYKTLLCNLVDPCNLVTMLLNIPSGDGQLDTIFLLKRGARDLKKQNMQWCS